METKKDIRKRVLEERNNLSKKEWKDKSERISRKIFTHPIFLSAEEVYCYVDFRNEVCTRQIIETCWKLRKKVAVPRIQEDKMEFYYISSWEEVSSGRWGILEPGLGSRAEGNSVCVLVPGTVFDKACNRIGYGKGYYDTYLQEHSSYRTIALAFELQIVEQIPTEEHDVCPKFVITEEHTYVK